MGQRLRSLIPWGTEAIVWVQSFRSGFLDVFFQGVTFLGEENFYLLFLPLIYWCVNKRVGIGLAYISLSSIYLNSAAKLIATQFRRRAFVALVALLILLIAFSRLYLGVHYPQDLMGGLLVGIVLLIVYNRLALWNRNSTGAEVCPGHGGGSRLLSRAEGTISNRGGPLRSHRPEDAALRPGGTCHCFPCRLALCEGENLRQAIQSKFDRSKNSC
ncbi:MAG: phosphatase PAP2 family protein [Chloroflexota bacterium]|nr:phosphatase PAP2 family protein [Chloroflexota bacterium]